jgi:hypothetical protein
MRPCAVVRRRRRGTGRSEFRRSVFVKLMLVMQ